MLGDGLDYNGGTGDVDLFPRINNIMEEDMPPGFNLPDDLIPRLDALVEKEEDVDVEDLLLRLGHSGEPPHGMRDR